MKALIIVDMIKEFVTGRFGSEPAQRIVPTIKGLISLFKEKGHKVIYACDAHKPWDKEFEIWGEHALENSEGAQVVDELQPAPDDIIIKKRRYDAFWGTDLEMTLKEFGINELFIVGISTDICVLNTVAGAFYRGFKTYVITDATASITEEGYKNGLEYIKKIYGAVLLPSEEVKKIL